MDCLSAFQRSSLSFVRKTTTGCHTGILRTRLVVVAMCRLVCSGLLTRARLSRRQGEGSVDRQFPELMPVLLIRTAMQMVPLIWMETIVLPVRRGHREAINRQRQSIGRLRARVTQPRSKSARKLLQATFARSAAAVIGQPIPTGTTCSLRNDRCLRDLLLTWMELALCTGAADSADSLTGLLSVHATLSLSQGDRLPEELTGRLKKLRSQLEFERLQTAAELNRDSLRMQLEQITRRILTVPVILENTLRQSTDIERIQG